ncbi:hypothetical protein F7725_014120 [Dissostichus mawsoni]|uniref:Uncharacterized protein n=1 Tax=Dissostichus mawsoni TaxID=36200 RepID=A0A7J5YV18_DISMA|nr:hypothetical protein F7725_014120 [Dissostichus mawsoni]
MERTRQRARDSEAGQYSIVSTGDKCETPMTDISDLDRISVQWFTCLSVSFLCSSALSQMEKQGSVGYVGEEIQPVPSEPAARAGWNRKMEYILAQVGFCVGFCNVWRFPYLCHQNGGGGDPPVLPGAGRGQAIRQGSIGVWKFISPWLAGIGHSSCVSPLPWEHCPVEGNVRVPECKKSSPTSYFWYRKALDITDSIDETGSFNPYIVGCLLAAWTRVPGNVQGHQDLCQVFSCIISFIIGLLFTQRCGNYFVMMFDDYSASLPLIIVVVFETFSVSWLYGADRFLDDIEGMLGWRPHVIYKYLWKYGSEEYLEYPDWALAVMALLIIFAVMPVPIALIHAVLMDRRTRQSARDSAAGQYSIVSTGDNCGSLMTDMSDLDHKKRLLLLFPQHWT